MSRLTQRGAGQRDNNNARKTPYVDASMAPRTGSIVEHTTPHQAHPHNQKILLPPRLKIPIIPLDRITVL